MNPAGEEQLSKHQALLAVGAVLIVQLLLVFWTFPVTELLTETPLFNIDGAYHWYQIEVAKELARQGQLVSYDPNFAAGYLGGVTLNASAKLHALVAICLASTASTTVAYKVTVFSLAVLGPAMVPAASGAFRLRPMAIWISAVLGLCLWWASGFRWFHTAGMTSFVFGAFLALAYTALLVQTALQLRPVRWILLLGAIGALGLFIHPLFPVPVALALLSFLLVFRREVRLWAALTALGSIAVLSAIPNLPWAIALASSGVRELGEQPYQRLVDPVAILKELAGVWGAGSMGSKIFAGLLVSGLYSAFFGTEKYLRQLAQACILSWLLMSLFAHIGASIPVVGALQPNRFASVAYLFLVPASAAIIPQLLASAWHAAGAKRLVAAGTTGVVAISFALSLRELAREVSYTPVGHYGAAPPEVRPIGPKTAWLLDWAKRKTSPEGRILFENSKGRVHDGAHIAGFAALSSGREFIGGPYPYMFSASAWDGEAFGTPIESMSIESFQKYLDLYNVGWIVAHSPEMKNFLRRNPIVVDDEDFENLQTFRVARSLNFFLKGSGDLKVKGFNLLTLSHLTGAEIVIKYHYVPGLAATPGTSVYPVYSPGVQEPFIGLNTQGATEATIFVH